MSSNIGVSTDASFAVTSARKRSPATTSSISRIERSCPIASGIIDCGKTTVSLRARIGSRAGRSTSSSVSTGISNEMSLIPAPGPPAGGRTSRALDDDHVPLARRGRLGDRKRDRDDPVLVPRPRPLRVDVLGQADLALERAVLDLHLLVDATVAALAGTLARDEERALADHDRQTLRVDPGRLDDHRELV